MRSEMYGEARDGAKSCVTALEAERSRWCLMQQFQVDEVERFDGVSLLNHTGDAGK